MKIYTILVIIGAILFLGSLLVWFRSGLIQRRNKEGARSSDRTGGYMFMSSLFIFALALLFWLVFDI